MKRPAILLASTVLLAAGGEQDETPGTSRWLHNPRARTEVGVELLADEEGEAARAAFGQALELAPDDPRVEYNAGTAGLLAPGPDADASAATALLERAAKAAQGDLRADAFYNLGNARLAAGDPGSAIGAYEESLRADPARRDAKHNLELARRLLEQQQKQQQRQQQDEKKPQDGESSEQEQQQQGGDDEDREEQQQPPGRDEQPQAGEEDQQPPEDSRQPLPNFEDQPEMTAEQAAAILEAVENLEREQRRKQALEQHKRAKGDEDW